MKKLTLVAVVVFVAVLGSLACKKGGDGQPSDPKSLCETIYKERVAGPIKMFAEDGPKNEAAFKEYCAKLPVEYLQCEAKDLFSMKEDEMKKCRDLIEVHQAGLNNVLMTGSPE